jgi:hypothetical protein
MVRLIYALLLDAAYRELLSSAPGFQENGLEKLSDKKLQGFSIGCLWWHKAAK